MRNDNTGQLFFAVVFSFGMLFPMSVPRQVNALRFTSLLGVMCSIYLCVAVAIVFFIDKEVVADRAAHWQDVKMFKVSFKGVVSTVPSIIFGYMYQVNIPMIYNELVEKNKSTMS